MVADLGEVGGHLGEVDDDLARPALVFASFARVSCRSAPRSPVSSRRSPETSARVAQGSSRPAPRRRIVAPVDAGVVQGSSRPSTLGEVVAPVGHATASTPNVGLRRTCPSMRDDAAKSSPSKRWPPVGDGDARRYSDGILRRCPADLTPVSSEAEPARACQDFSFLSCLSADRHKSPSDQSFTTVGCSYGVSVPIPS